MLLHLDMTHEDGTCCALSDDELHAICMTVLTEEGVRRSCFLSLSIVSDAQMRSLNMQWRSQGRPTDVLSLECERPDDPDLGEDEPCELGDIILAPAYIAEQAKRFGTTPADETRLLTVHGVLHLLGYDHVVEEEAQVMEAREDELLELIDTDANMTGTSLTRHEGEKSL